MCKTPREYYELSKQEYVCEKCGKTFMASRWCRDRITGRGNRFCSIKCSKLKLEPIKCVVCGKIFRPPQKGSHGSTRTHCSRKCYAEHRKLLYRGQNCPSWLGGKSFEPYGTEFNKELREEIRKRDNYRCQQCFRNQGELYMNTKAGIRPRKLYVHHIDYNKTNNDTSNLISLCLVCHAQTNYGRKDWTEYFKQKLCQL